MIRALFQDKRFLVGFIFVFGLFVASIVYEFVKEYLNVRQGLLYDDHMNLLGAAPFPPSWMFPLGTDSRGYDMLYKGIEGAKYTIGFALIVAFLRLLLSSGVGVFRAMFTKPLPSKPSNVLDSFQYLPMALLCYFILKPVVYINPRFGVLETLVFETVIITLVAVPTVSVLIANEIEVILQREFIVSARTLGSGKFHILLKHVRPHVWPRLMIIFVQQVIQVLLILLHLGLFTLFLGGTLRERTLTDWVYYSSTNDWASVFGFHYSEVNLFPWIPLSMVLFFGVTLVFLNFMLEGMKDVFSGRQEVPAVRKKRRRRDKERAVGDASVALGDEAFTAVNRNDFSV
ncbi:MAG TPA: ABC transporter permease subunit [Bacillales bacterium]|nr:ABC transporter permease subunit [Bacillales bacterium]